MAEPKKRTYQSTTLGVPPLRMVLVHARNDAINAALPATPAPEKPLPTEEVPAEKEKAVRRIIQHLQSNDS